MQELTITDLESGQRLNKYMMKYLNQAPSSFIYKMLRKKNITRNGKKASGDENLNKSEMLIGHSPGMWRCDQSISGG